MSANYGGNKRPFLSLGNLYLGINALFAAAALFYPVVFALLASYLVFTFGWEAAGSDSNYLIRTGAVLQFVGLSYLFLQEFVIPTPQKIGSELRGDPTISHISEAPETKQSAEKLIKITREFERLHRPITRSVEFAIIGSGTIINGYGDKIYTSITGIP